MPQAASFDSILEQCRDLVSERVSDALAKMLDEADDALTTFASQSRDPETSEIYEVARNKVLSQREAIVTQFRMRFLREFQERGNRVKKIGDKFAEVDLSSLEQEQEQAGEDDLNASLKFDAMASRLRQYCEEELLALDQRFGVLVGDADLQSEDNPLTPQAIVDAYKHTCRHFDSNVDVQMVLLKLFDDYVLDEMRSVYKAVNALLIENSILPKIRLPVVRGKDGTKAQSGESRPVEQAPGNVSSAPILDNILQELKNTDLGSTMTRMHTMTLDVMAVLFDDLFDDRKIPTAVKGLIGRLQTPMLKVAIADKSFFSRKSHPARQLLDALGEFSVHLPADIDESDPVYQKLESLLEGVIEGSEDDVKIFDNARQQLDTLIVEQNEHDEQEMQPVDTLIVEQNEHDEQETQPVDTQVNQAEKLAIAKTVAQAELSARVHASPTSPLIAQFLAQQWVKLLIAVHVKEGEQSEVWKNALKTVDLLLWSSKCKETAEERRKMVEILPKLLKSLADGLAYVGTDDDIRVKFFSELRKSHALIMGRSAQPAAKAPGEKSEIEDAPQAAASIAVQNAARNGDTFDLRATPPKQAKPAKAGTGEQRRLDYLAAGTKPAANGEQAVTAKAKTVSPGKKSPKTDTPPATAEQAVVPAKPAAQDAAPDEARPNADSEPPLEFEAGLLKSGEQPAAPAATKPFADSQPPLEFEAGLLKSGEQAAKAVDVEAMVNSLPSLEFEAEPETPGEQSVVPADTASGAQPVPRERRAGPRDRRAGPRERRAGPRERRADPPSAEAVVHEAADRIRSEKPEPEPTKSTTRTSDEPSAELRAEMDHAMEVTRTMFSDVDRFIILGQVRNATNLLESRIKHQPTDRDSWIKLMAIYRDEGMDGGFNRTYAAFREQFGENASA